MNGKKNILSALAGLGIGAVNGLLGAGGGMIAVPILLKLGLERKQAHANAVAVILPITLVSAAMYVYRGYVSIGQAIAFVPGGAVGSLVGVYILKKISPLWLKRIFGAFMIYAGVRLLAR